MSGGWAEVRQIRNYFAMITGVDDQFGRILRALDGQALAENTIVVFTSDHGNCLGCHGEATKNVHWEEAMRVPFLIRWPGRIAPRRDSLLLSSPDICPTLLDLMGLGRRIPQGVQGTSYAGLFRTGRGRRPTSQLYIGTTAERPNLGRRGVRTETHTLLVRREPGRPRHTELYDRVADPFQLRDIAADRPDLARSLMEDELFPWLRRADDRWRPEVAL